LLNINYLIHYLKKLMSKPVFCRLEQLAHLGLPSQTFIPAILQELHHLIPSVANTFCWQDEEENLSNIYDETENINIHEAFGRSIASQAPDKYTHTIQWVSQLDTCTTSFENFDKCPFIAEFYKTIMLPAGYTNTCFIPIFHNTTKKRLGVLMIHRPRSAKSFSEEDRTNLQHITTIIARGIEQAGKEKPSLTDGWSQGLLISDKMGELQYACSMGDKLLSLASSSQVGSKRSRTPSLNNFTGIKELLEKVIKQNKYKPQENDPTLSITNAWGQFQLRGFFLQNKSDDNTSLIGLNIRWQEPFVLTLFHRIKMLSLTPRQETVGLLYAAGDQYQTIAEKLGLSLYTVKDHIKNISARLNINSRADLIELILCSKT